MSDISYGLDINSFIVGNAFTPAELNNECNNEDRWSPTNTSEGNSSTVQVFKGRPYVIS